MQTAVTIATAACCSPQNAVNMDYLSNYASGKFSLLTRLAEAVVVTHNWDAPEPVYHVSPSISNPYALLSWRKAVTTIERSS
jgi:hypothetical protein